MAPKLLSVLLGTKERRVLASCKDFCLLAPSHLTSVSPSAFSFFPASRCELLLGLHRGDNHGGACLEPKEI